MGSTPTGTGTPTGTPASAAEPEGRVLRLLRVERTVSDLPRAVAFYRDALGFAIAGERADGEPAGADLSKAELPGADLPEPSLSGTGPVGTGPSARAARAASLTLGTQELRLVAFAATGRPYPPDSNAADLWFQHIAVVTGDMSAAWRRLQGHGATAITRDGPQRLPDSSGGVTAFKFRDPDGHPAELLQFPREGTERGASITTGVDHSAISVADIGRSVAFYTGLLGVRVAARQLNRGVEQERLDDLADVAVDVVALEPGAAKTPHLELLGYRNPRGRPAPSAPEPEPQDVVADRLVLEVAGLPALVRRLARAGFPAISAACVTPDAGRAVPMQAPPLRGLRSVLVRDPDRHLLVLREVSG